MMAAQAIQLGEASVVVAGGTESMSRAPYLLDHARGGYRLGNGELVDSMIRDGLWDVYNEVHMGTCGDKTATHCGISREEQDDYAVRSYTLAQESAEKGWAADEIVSVDTQQKRETVTVSSDEEPLRFNEAKLRGLRPAFGADGSVTAGNASTINDGAAAVVCLSRGKVDELGVQPLARILGYATYSREPEWFTLAPVGVQQKLLEQLDMKVDDIDVFEINEAFAVVALAAIREMHLPLERVNPLGGAIAIGHPIGASGTRTLVTLLNALRVRGGKTGMVSLCVGGGEAVGMVVELV